jgi:hypothetical protein
VPKALGLERRVRAHEKIKGISPNPVRHTVCASASSSHLTQIELARSPAVCYDRGMAGRKRPKIQEKDVTGLKYFDKLAPLLERLHGAGCERDKAGNRQLFFDQLCLLQLLFLFNPIVSSLRAIEQASELKKVQKRLGCGRASLGSLAEASRVFDADLLREVIAELGKELEPIGRDPRLKDIPQLLTLVDGTLLDALPALASASLLKSQTGCGFVKWRLHTHFEVDRYVPTRIDVTRNGGGDADERSVLERAIEADRCYVMDRGYAKFSLFNRIHAARSSYVCRIRDNSNFTVLEERPLSHAARAAHVVQDSIIAIGETSKAEARPDHRIRLVVVKTAPHVKRGKWNGGGSTGPGNDGYLRIATDLLEVPAEVIALMFQFRWSIELFFRFFKHVLGCRHLLSHDENGIEIQTYCAVIACMLISLWTGRKPTLRTYEMVCYYFIGLADEEELLAHIQKLQKHDAAPRLV